ncbi:MAG: radical SAM protein [Candidatus Omnitrophica bacterium]|nr:radical SAM protein [Candidatus Omnitrophota bacterium]
MSKNNGELNLKQVAEKHTDFPQLIIRKIDTALRGVNFTERAVKKAWDLNALYDAAPELETKGAGLVFGGALFRDGTLVQGVESISSLRGRILRKDKAAPYTLDAIDGKLWLLDDKQPVEEIDFVPIPEYYGKKTSRGTPMIKVVRTGPPDCLNVNVYGYCLFWKEKLPCKYCCFQESLLREGLHTQESLDDIYETVSEALKEKGRWTGMRLIAGSDFRGKTPYENDSNEYIRVLKTLQRSFGTKNIYARLVASAVPKEHLERVKEAGAVAYEPHIEVWDKKVFGKICPGKAKFFGWQYWVDNIIDAVKVFGRGNVCSQLVAGAELAQPYGFKSVEKALKSNLEGVEFLAQHGANVSFCVLWVGQGSVFFAEKQTAAPLEYYVRLAKGIRDIRKKYKLAVDFNDYRRCAIHPDTDLARLDYNEVSYEPVGAGEGR